ncbi:hypothetical protein IAU60_001320 [Kwoniella sp. DSM 27419]
MSSSTSRAGVRAPSPVPPRPSISSNRSSRKTEADFEAALLDTRSTIYLSGGSPNLDAQGTGLPTLGPPAMLNPANGGRDTLLSEGKRGDQERVDHVDRHRENGSETSIDSPARGLQMPGIIPPTPSTSGYTRRDSMLTMDSGASETPPRRIPSKSVGLDTELGEKARSKHPLPKRRSIFRSPGTASSPDLVTLVRKAKEARADSEDASTVNQTPATTSNNRAASSSRATPSPTPSSSYQIGRERSATNPRGEDDLSRMPSIAESSTTPGGRSRQHTEDGFKSMRNKAKGVFGKMFGSSRTDHSTRPTARTDQPPVPPVPVAYANNRRKAPDPPEDVFSASAIRSPAVLTSIPPSRDPTLSRDGRGSVTPTGDRQVSGGSNFSIDKPLPEIRRTPSDRQRSSGHIRQPASVAAEDSPPRNSHTPKPTPSPATQAVSNFTADMTGMLAGIGQTDPARELGLPPDSLSSQRERNPSIDSVTESRKRAPAELARAVSAQDGTRRMLSPIPAQRTSSLPHVSSIPSSTIMSNRTASSPNPSTVEASLTPGAPALSRTSSRSSGRKASVKGSKSPSSLVNDPSETSSIRLVTAPRPDGPTSAGLSDPPDFRSASPFATSALWQRQTPRSTSTPQIEDEVEVVDTPPLTPKTPYEDEQEDRGRRLACEFLENDTRTIAADKVAEFLGGPLAINAVALKYYMRYFNMNGQNLVEAFRDLCQKLHLKAESQEIDRIIEGFSSRYFECNPTTVFGTPGVVHTVTAAMLMLNTDLHIAELDKHMSRADFVRNALRAIHMSIPEVDGISTPDLVSPSNKALAASTTTAPSTVRAKAPNAPRSASAPIVNHPPGPSDSTSSIGTGGKTRSSSTAVSLFNYGKAWEADAEAALRDIYTSVKSDRILLPITNSRQSMLSVSSGSYDRSKTMKSPDRVNALKRGSMRGMQGLNNQYGTWSGSDGRLSPTPSYATSINDNLGSFTATLGFASNLSHTVIREHDDELSDSSHIDDSDADEMDDDELALLGAPWAKEGLLSRKLYWESVGKRAKKAEWKQFFVVISKGDLFMFTFGAKGGAGLGGTVGGGNWLENANAIGTISLMHTMAVALPKPGYNASRPYCFSLASPSGETSFFQAGTEDLVGEWVSTCNYWAARKSRQPLQGGVSNMEYGWNRVVDPSDEHDDRASVRSARSNLSKLGGTYGRRTVGAHDRIYINDWKPPPPATISSPLDEEAQLDALQAYVKTLKDDLEQHKAVEEAMSRLYTPGSRNLVKAKENWKAKSHYIHTEIYKYETYVESLRNAISLRVKKQGEKKLERSLARSISLHGRDSVDEDGYAGDMAGRIDMATVRR